MEVKKITVLGSGTMGHGIAQSFLMGGYPVMLFDISEPILATAKAHVKKNLELFFKSDLIKEEDIEACLGRLSTTTDLEKAVQAANFIVASRLDGEHAFGVTNRLNIVKQAAQRQDITDADVNPHT